MSGETRVSPRDIKRRFDHRAVSAGRAGEARGRQDQRRFAQANDRRSDADAARLDAQKMAEEQAAFDDYDPDALLAEAEQF